MATVKNDKKRPPLPLQATSTLGEAVEDHVMRRLAELFPQQVASLPAVSRTARDMTMQLSITNQTYYLGKAKELGKPWFQTPRFPYQYSEHVLITPQMAYLLLEHNVGNRLVDEALIETYARDIINGRWLQSGECIQIDLTGNMFDGQHRAHGITKAGKAWPIYVTWNVPCEARFIVDSGRKRNINQKTAFIVGDTAGMGNKLAAVCKSMMSGCSYRGYRFSESEIASFAVKHEKVLQWLAKHLPGYRADVQAVMGKALLWYGELRTEEFCEKLVKCVFPTPGDPAGSLFRFLQKTRNQRGHSVPGVTVYKKTLGAFDHFLNHRQVERLFDKDEDIFEWETGWVVPANAPTKSNQ
jgi:hypothetical protein